MIGEIPGSIAEGVRIPPGFPDPRGEGWELDESEPSFVRPCTACRKGTMRNYLHGKYFKSECDSCGFLYDTGEKIGQPHGKVSDKGRKEMFQEIYDSEINFEVSCFWDGGFDIRVGDEMNGWVGGTNVDTWDEVGPALEGLVVEHFPDSTFAEKRKEVIS